MKIDPLELGKREFLIYMAGWGAGVDEMRPQLELANRFAEEACDAAAELEQRLRLIDSRGFAAVVAAATGGAR
jgi:hypothetical protein